MLVDWDELRGLDLGAVRARMRHPVIVDCVGIVDAPRAREQGVGLRAMGRILDR